MLGGAAIRNVPENTGRIAKVKDSDSPWLHRRGFTNDAGILFGEFLALEMLPPCIRIFDGQAHHEIAGVLLDVKGLEQEAELADLEFGNLVVAPIDSEAEIGVEPFGEFGVFGGDKGLEIGHRAWEH